MRINQELLNASLFVLHSTAAATTNLVEVSWETKDVEGEDCSKEISI